MPRSVIGELVWKIVGDTTSIDSQLKKSGLQVNKFNRGLQVVENSAFGVAAAVAVIAKEAFTTGKAFDQGLGNVATLLNDPINSIEGLKDEVKDLAIDTGLSLDALTDGLYQTVSAFGDTAESTDQLTLAAKAARAGVTSVTDSINLASAVTKAYGDTSADAQQKVFDLAFETVRLGQTTFPELASSIQNVTDRSQALSVSQEDLFTSFATLTGVTGNASQVATQLRSALVALDSPTETLADLYERLGVASGKALIEQEGLQGAFQLIFEDSEKTGTSLNDYLGRVEAVTAVSALASSQSEVFSAKLGEISEASGALDAAFKTQNETLNGTGAAYDRLTQSVEVLKTTIFDFWSEDLANTFNGLTVITKALGDANDGIQEFQNTLGGEIFQGAAALLNPIKGVVEYNSQFFKLIGNLGRAEESSEEFTSTLTEGLSAADIIQQSITEELAEQERLAADQVAEIQRIVDLEAERVRKVIEDQGLIKAAYDNEIRIIETKNALGLLSEQEFRDKRLAAEQKLVDDLVQLGYDGLALKGEELQEGDKLIQASIDRQLALAEDGADKQISISDKVRASNQTTWTEAEKQQESYQKELTDTQQRMLQLSQVGIGTLTSGFSTLGEELAKGELSWKSFARVGLEAAASLLDAIGAQLAAQAALAAVLTLTGNPVAGIGVGPALLASAAAYTAAGVVRASAAGLESGGIVPGAPSVSDNRLAMVRSGEEVIPEEDPRHSNNDEGKSEMTINLIWDGDIVARSVVNDYMRTGQYVINARAIEQ